MKLTVATVVLFLAVIALAIAQFNTINTVRSLESKLASVQSDQAKTREQIDAEAAHLRDSAAAAETERQKALDSVRDEVEKAKRQAQETAGKASAEALKSVGELATQVHSSEAKIKDNDVQVAREITGLKQATSAAQSSINAVSTEVTGVKSEVATANRRLENTIADLQNVNGDLGAMKTVVATNAQEIEALRQLGDRDYTQFTIFKTKEPVRLADISVLLKKTDPKSNRYSIQLQVGDRKLEKKDLGVNEPLQFYADRDNRLHELVVNRVGKDQIAGYLAIPKVAATRP
jgi:chromosome segregation ATPase